MSITFGAAIDDEPQAPAVSRSGGGVRESSTDVGSTKASPVTFGPAIDDEPEPSGPSPTPSRNDYATEIGEAAKRHGVDPDLIKSIIGAESGGDPRAVSRKGARGLMQLMPETQRALGVRDPFDPGQNIDGGVRHLKGLLERYQGNKALAVAAYNAGADAVDQHGGIPPYPETRQYVQRVLGGPVPQWQSSSSRPGLFTSPAQRQAAIDRGRQSSQIDPETASGLEVTRALLRMGYSRAEIDRLTPDQAVAHPLLDWHLENQDHLEDPRDEQDQTDAEARAEQAQEEREQAAEEQRQAAEEAQQEREDEAERAQEEADQQAEEERTASNEDDEVGAGSGGAGPGVGSSRHVPRQQGATGGATPTGRGTTASTAPGPSTAPPGGSHALAAARALRPPLDPRLAMYQGDLTADQAHAANMAMAGVDVNQQYAMSLGAGSGGDGDYAPALAALDTMRRVGHEAILVAPDAAALTVRPGIPLQMTGTIPEAAQKIGVPVKVWNGAGPLSQTAVNVMTPTAFQQLPPGENRVVAGDAQTVGGTATGQSNQQQSQGTQSQGGQDSSVAGDGASGGGAGGGHARHAGAGGGRHTGGGSRSGGGGGRSKAAGKVRLGGARVGGALGGGVGGRGLGGAPEKPPSLGVKSPSLSLRGSSVGGRVRLGGVRAGGRRP